MSTLLHALGGLIRLVLVLALLGAGLLVALAALAALAIRLAFTRQRGGFAFRPVFRPAFRAAAARAGAPRTTPHGARGLGAGEVVDVEPSDRG